VLNSHGATVMCLELIAVGIDFSLCVSALKLLVVLLARNGGNSEVQETIYEFLSQTDSVLFFEQIKDMLEQQMLWCQREGVNSTARLGGSSSSADTSAEEGTETTRSNSMVSRRLSIGRNSIKFDAGKLGFGTGSGVGGECGNAVGELPEMVIVLKFLRSMCDGCFLNNKEIIREQTGNTRWVNILDCLGSYADVLSRLEGELCTKVAIRVMHAILGLM
jgi:hypothetical protein